MKDSVPTAAHKKRKPTHRRCQSKTTTRCPTLRFTPHAWAKLLFLRDQGDTEVGGFGITSAEDLLLVEDIQLMEQECTVASVEFDDDSVADFFDRQDQVLSLGGVSTELIELFRVARIARAGFDETQSSIESRFGLCELALLHQRLKIFHDRSDALPFFRMWLESLHLFP